MDQSRGFQKPLEKRKRRTVRVAPAKRAMMASPVSEATDHDLGREERPCTGRSAEEEEEGHALRSFLRDMRTSLRGISTKQDSQHSMIVYLGGQLREETAESRRDVSAINKRFEDLHISRHL